MDADGKSGNAVAEARVKIDATYENEKDKKLVTEAYDYAEKMHEGQKRASGEPYFVHPCSVANILMDMGLDAPTVAAAFLHDVVEDTAATEEDIREKFGEEVEELVAGVTKLNKIVFESKEQEEAENFRKIVVAMAKDIRVIIIKLADQAAQHAFACLPFARTAAGDGARNAGNLYAAGGQTGYFAREERTWKICA